MAAGNDSNVEGFAGGVRLAWSVHLMLIHDGVSIASSNDSSYLNSCLEFIFSHNVFQFLLDNVLRTAAYQVCLVECFSFFPHYSCKTFISSNESHLQGNAIVITEHFISTMPVLSICFGSYIYKVQVKNGF